MAALLLIEVGDQVAGRAVGDRDVEGDVAAQLLAPGVTVCCPTGLGLPLTNACTSTDAPAGSAGHVAGDRDRRRGVDRRAVGRRGDRDGGVRRAGEVERDGVGLGDDVPFRIRKANMLPLPVVATF